ARLVADVPQPRKPLPPAPMSATDSTTEQFLRVVAFYLPQFHPVPENDAWWGSGFTEWTNVVRARPRFPDHYQPHLPTELGFYDLRVPEVREQQAALAREYGIHGFCYYHYWFGGERHLDRPFKWGVSNWHTDFPCFPLLRQHNRAPPLRRPHAT